MNAYLGVLMIALSGLGATAEDQALRQPPFCGNLQKHQVLRTQVSAPGVLAKNKARIYMYWRGARLRWLGRQCKVALNGTWVAVLSPNTYSVIDAEEGNLKFCGASNVLSPTWRSLLFLHATGGETYFVECSPGGDAWGASDPTLSETEQEESWKAVSRLRVVTFRLKSPRRTE